MRVINGLLALSVLLFMGCTPSEGGQSGSDLDCLPGDCFEADARADTEDTPDCGGIGGSDMGCPECADHTSPDVQYKGQSQQICFTLLFSCEPWQEAFFDACGCGCLGPIEEPETQLNCGGIGGSDMGCPECADSTSPDVRYVGESAQSCFTLLFTCEPGEEQFFDRCGCGCLSS